MSGAVHGRPRDTTSAAQVSKSFQVTVPIFDAHLKVAPRNAVIRHPSDCDSGGQSGYLGRMRSHPAEEIA